MKHTTECRWILTTNVECEYRQTHHYCPHPEHACDCREARTFACADPGVQRTHMLKVWPEQFNDTATGRKTFEIRLNDRGYRVGDVLILREYDPVMERFNERACKRVVSHILAGNQFGLAEGFVAMSLLTPPQITTHQEAQIRDKLKGS